MRLRRQVPQPTRRQKLRADGLDKAPAAFSYRTNRSDQGRAGTKRQTQSAGQQAPARSIKAGSTWWLRRLGLIVLLIAVTASAVNILSLSASPKVVPLNNGSGSSFLRPTSVYQEAASQQLKRSVWNRNKVTVNTSQLNRQLLKRFPELNSVSVTVPLLAHRPLVYVQSAQPAVILVARNGAFVVDTNGKALVKAADPAALNQPKLPVLNDQSGLNIQLNRQALSANNVRFIQTVNAQLVAKQFQVSGMTLPAAASQLDVRLIGQPYFLKFNLQHNTPREQAGTFLATISRLRSQNITPGQYVDVRVEGRAYYK